jgi:hypothetical protein
MHLSQEEEHKKYIPGKGIYSKKQHAIYKEATHVCQPIQTISTIGDHQVVDFRNVYGVPLDFLIDLSKRNGKRLRLLPPYRVHLSQAFARFPLIEQFLRKAITFFSCI